MVDAPPLPPPAEPAPPQAPAPARATRPAGRTRFHVPWRARLVHAFTTSPSYGLAVLFHAVLLLVLSLWTVWVLVPETPAEVGVRLVRATEVEPGDPAPPLESLDSLLEAPELPDAAASDAPALDASLGRSAGAALVDAPVPFGLLATGPAGPGDAKGEGKGKRGGGGRSGASKQSDGARDAALEWLKRHRTSQGAWGVVPQEARDHDELGDPTVAHTGLGLLCYLCAGAAPGADGPYRDVVEKAEAWLVAQVDKDGQFEDSRREWEKHYHQAIGTLALAEALQRRRTPQLEQAVKRSVAYLERARGRWGWRYSPRQDADTSVNGWVVLALKSAEHAKVAVDPKDFQVVREFLDRTTSEDGTTGYTTRRDPKDSMTATGLFLRIMLGEAPDTRRNRAAARLVARMRRFDEYDFGLYGLYYAALAMYQVGGPQWEEWNPLVRDKLVRGMNDRKGACEHGSWQPIGFMNDLCLSTALATLTLQTYYRYLPVHGGIAGAELEPKEAEPAPPDPSQGQLALDEAARALLEARRTRDPGALLVAEAAYERAVPLLVEEPDLQREVRARLVEVADLSRDGGRALSRAEEYMAALPPGTPPDRAVLRVRRRERHRQVALRAEGLAALGGPEQLAEAKRLSTDARALAGQIEAELAACDPEPDEREEAERMVLALRQLSGALLLQGGDEAGLATALTEVERAPASGVPSDLETRALIALLGRASSGYEAAARGDAAGWERGERDRARLLARRPAERLLGDVRAAFVARLEALELVRLAALLGLEREAEVLAGLAALTWPSEAHASERCALERTALARRVERGLASAPERERFGQVLRAWSRQNPRLAGPERLALGQRLLELGDTAEAARQLELAAARPAELQGDLLRQAHLALARARRQLGDPAASLAVLEALPAAVQKDLAVRLERCLAHRAAKDPGVALDEYLKLLRALAEGRPPEWWHVTEEAARTYVELGRVDEAREMLDGVRRLDPGFGGDEARRDRFVRLMHELDRVR